ncbi:MAG: RHS repeat-associated core domain-containing protein, partial [Clostridia bacterium]|nr:RHS repeat-associated core domain-containing protein [Clostridia bacterium]
EYSYEDYKKTTPDDVRYSKKSQTFYADGQSYKFVYLKEGSLNDDERRFNAHESLTVGKDTLFIKNYDIDGILTGVTYKNATEERIVVYEYDNYHNLIKAETKNSSGANILLESNTYNEYADITAKTLTGAVTQTYSYAYKQNAARTLDSVSVEGYTFKPLSDVYGRNTGREIYSGENKLAAEYVTYRKVGDHATNMPATVWFGNGEKIAESIKYKYDSCGNICQVTQNGHIVVKYAYDSLNRLIREDNKPLNKTVLFSYDRCGNITERCEYAYTSKSGEELAELKCTHYSYDYEGDKLKEYNGETFAYNNLGCPTTYRGKSATWIYGKLLASYNGVQFTYNGLGSRASKGEITFTYDSDGRLIKQSNGLEFIYDVSGVAGVKHNGETYLYRKDAQGNIIAILDSTGKVVVKYAYGAWGNHTVKDNNGRVITSGIGVLNPFRYRGYYYDTETELYYLQTRYYDPEVGRFISQDSIEYADPETINGINLYAYCGNNPVMNVDP